MGTKHKVNGGSYKTFIQTTLASSVCYSLVIWFSVSSLHWFTVSLLVFHVVFFLISPETSHSHSSLSSGLKEKITLTALKLSWVYVQDAWQTNKQTNWIYIQVDSHYLDSNTQFFETEVWYCHSSLTARNTKPEKP